MNDAQRSSDAEGDLSPQPQATALALNAAWYADPVLAARERAAVWSRHWQLVAHASQLVDPGDHVVADIADVPLVVVRGSDRRLRALHNVCRHRAGPVAVCDGTSARTLTCKYHGWTYELDGRLRGAPEMSEVPGFVRADIRLPEAHVAEWQGLVFAALDPATEFATVVGGVDERIAKSAPESRLVDYRHAGRKSYSINCNWKVYVDNFLEGYHLPVVHPRLNRVLDYRSYRTELAPWLSLQSSPIDAGQGPYGGGEALYYWFFPNTMLNVLPGRSQTNRVVPIDSQRCRVDFDYFYPLASTASAAESDQLFADEVQAEDIAICEAVQRGLASGSYRAGRLNPAREAGVWHFHELLRNALRPGSLES